MFDCNLDDSGDDANRLMQAENGASSNNSPPFDDDELASFREIILSELNRDIFAEQNSEPKSAEYQQGNFTWTGDPDIIEMNKFEWNSVLPNPGPTSLVTDYREPYQFVDALLPDDLIQWLVECTNAYGRNKHKTFIDTDLLEMKALLAAFIFLGLNGNPPTELAFSSDLIEGIAAVSLAFSLKRFDLLRSCLSFDKTEDVKSSEQNKMSQIKFVFETLLNRFQLCYICGKHVRLDDGLITYRNRFGDNEPTKNDIKVWALCDANSNYIVNAEIYTGNVLYKTTLTQAPEVALRLTESIADCGRTVYCDATYTTPMLAKTLLERKIYCVGAMNRDADGIPKEMRLSSLQQPGTGRKAFQPRSGFVFCSDPDAPMMLVVYEPKPNKLFYLLSSKSGRPEVLSDMANKPRVALEYEKWKSPVGPLDILRYGTSCATPTRRVNLRLFYWMLDAVYFNAYVLHREVVPPTRRCEEEHERKIFLSAAARKFLNDYTVRRLFSPTANEQRRYSSEQFLNYMTSVARLARGEKRRFYEESYGLTLTEPSPEDTEIREDCNEFSESPAVTSSDIVPKGAKRRKSNAVSRASPYFRP